MTVADALLSPTRTYAPVLADLLNNHRPEVLGLVHCTGGGQAKCLRFGSGVRFVKDELFDPPPVFRAIQEASGADDREMYRVFNMGHRMEVYCRPDFARTVVETAAAYGVDARVVGGTEPSPDGRNVLVLRAGGKSESFNATGLPLGVLPDAPVSPVCVPPPVGPHESIRGPKAGAPSCSQAGILPVENRYLAPP